jgi:dTDP-4-amino-4,6-dideoxygalactose transaminase
LDKLCPPTHLRGKPCWIPVDIEFVYGDVRAVVNDDEDLAKKIWVLRNYGSKKKYLNEVKGFNSRLDPLQVAFLLVKLPYLVETIIRRQLHVLIWKNLAKILI